MDFFHLHVIYIKRGIDDFMNLYLTGLATFYSRSAPHWRGAVLLELNCTSFFTPGQNPTFLDRSSLRTTVAQFLGFFLFFLYLLCTNWPFLSSTSGLFQRDSYVLLSFCLHSSYRVFRRSFRSTPSGGTTALLLCQWGCKWSFWLSLC